MFVIAYYFPNEVPSSTKVIGLTIEIVGIESQKSRHLVFRLPFCEIQLRAINTEFRNFGQEHILHD
jgi:hypothetical protein